MRAHEDFRFIAGWKRGKQGFAPLFGLDPQIRGTPAEGLPDQAFDVAASSQCDDIEQIRVFSMTRSVLTPMEPVLPKRATGRGKAFSHSDEGSSVI